MVYLIHPHLDVYGFVLKGVDDGITVKTRPLNWHCNKLQLVIRKVFANAKLFSWMLFDRQLCRELKQLKEGDSVVVCDHCELCLFRTLSSVLAPNVKKFFWIWNPVKVCEKEFYIHLFRAMKNENFSPCTFDSRDAKEFGLVLLNPFFPMNQKVKNNDEFISDFYFIGYAKNRESTLLDLQKKLSAYKTYFKIIHSAKEYISYEENIKRIMGAKCLVEIIQDGQSGMTIRTLEALAFEKKLISNNKRLKTMDFYHPNNIFILGIDNLEKIEEFANKPIVKFSKTLLQKYDVYTWINNFK